MPQAEPPYRFEELRGYFPHETPNPLQEEGLDIIAQSLPTERGVVLEQPTGTGKSAQGIALLRLLLEQGKRFDDDGALVMATTTRSLVNQIQQQYPKDLQVVYGRHEYPCVFYRSRGVDARADEIPCGMLVRKGLCPHVVRSLSEIPTGVEPCPYYLDKVRAESGSGIKVCTHSYMLLEQVFRPRPIRALVVDEVDQLAEMARLVFSYDITDYHLKALIKLLEPRDKTQARRLKAFLDLMLRIANLKPIGIRVLLDENEVRRLFQSLGQVSLDAVEARVEEALGSGELDPVEHREELVAFERMTRSFTRYLHSFKYALEEEGKRNPLNYLMVWNERDAPGEQRVRCKITVQTRYVAGLIRHAMRNVRYFLGYSGTVGRPDLFSFETGLHFPVHSFPSPFPPENIRIYFPSDAKDLNFQRRGRRDLDMMLRWMAEDAAVFGEHDIRVLSLLQSETERKKLLGKLARPDFHAVTYGDGVSPREALIRFRDGSGDGLVGTMAHFGRGSDLPGRTAEVVQAFRPGFPNPNDPAALFERRIYTEAMYYALQNHRVSVETRQWLGRIIRSATDRGVAIVYDKQFGQFLPGGLDARLQRSWITGKTRREIMSEAPGFLRPAI